MFFALASRFTHSAPNANANAELNPNENPIKGIYMHLLPTCGAAVLAFYDLREANKARVFFTGREEWEKDIPCRFIVAGELAQVRVFLAVLGSITRCFLTGRILVIAYRPLLLCLGDRRGFFVSCSPADAVLAPESLRGVLE